MTIQDVIQYVEVLPNLFSRQSVLTGSEIGNGNMNFVFRVVDAGLHGLGSVIVKCTPPYMRSVGSAWPLTAERIRVEHDALTIQHELCPGLVPKVYHYDQERSLMVMEDLWTHTLLRDGLMARQIYPQVAPQIGKFLARTLFLTSQFALDAGEVEELKHRFANAELVRITTDFIFTFPFTAHAMNRFSPLLGNRVHEMWENGDLQSEVAALRTRFNTDGQALIHGDLHTGSLMVTEQDTKVIDPEFACYGPMGFDSGVLMANLLLNLCLHASEGNRTNIIGQYQRELLKIIEMVWAHFHKEFKTLWLRTNRGSGRAAGGEVEHVLVEVLQDSLGFAGCEMIRRVIGTSHVRDLNSIEDASRRARAEILALTLGQHLIMERHHAHTIQDLIEYVHDSWLTCGETKKTYR
ncbi:MAG: S-methyl-5-thioribose kinase [Sulfobacillus sp.]